MAIAIIFVTILSDCFIKYYFMIKPTLVLLHGFLQPFTFFPKFIHLLEKSYKIINIDLPGYGKNIGLNIFEINEYLGFIYCEIQSQNTSRDQNINILGWSLGGNIAVLLATKYPKDFNNLILLCSNPCFVQSENNIYGMDKDIFSVFYDSIKTNYQKTVDRFLKLQFFGLEKTDFKNNYLKLKQLFETHNKPNSETLIFNLDILNTDIRNKLENLENKIIYILSNRDNLIPKDLIFYLENIKKTNDTIYSIPDACHVPIETNISEIINLLEISK